VWALAGFTRPQIEGNCVILRAWEVHILVRGAGTKHR
jgi:hypothetical protein